MTHPYPRRSAANWADFLGRLEAWVPAEVEQVYTIVDNRQTHQAVDVLLFVLAFTRWECVFQPKYAAYLNLIEPWKVLKSLALKGRRFKTWEKVCGAVEEATGTGTSIAIRSSGADAGDTGPGAGRGSQPSQVSGDLPDEPIRGVAALRLAHQPIVESPGHERNLYASPHIV